MKEESTWPVEFYANGELNGWGELTEDQIHGIRATLAGYRLEALREMVRAECISYGEIAELEELAEFIPAGDVELLEWANVKEGTR